jgi:two-component system, OmpR family, torCAD operon response regulator TorR
MDAQAKILVVEDEPTTRATLVYFLERNGFDVRAASTAAAAYALLRDEPFTLILVDINLPDRDGLSLAEDVARSFDVAIVFITQRTERETRLRALETTGDDYVTKPVDLRELLARIRRIIRRRGESRSQVVAVGPFEIDLETRSVRSATTGALDLTRGEFDLLAALVRSNGSPVSRESLVTAVSRDLESSDLRTVDTLISRLRRKLGETSRKPRLLMTEQGVGYRLNRHP